VPRDTSQRTYDEGSPPPSLGPGSAIRDETYGDETNDKDVMPELVGDTEWDDVDDESVWGDDDDDDDAVWAIIDGAHRWYVSSSELDERLDSNPTPTR
jgi:hypothetical protein